jgi:hypothetical protein
MALFLTTACLQFLFIWCSRCLCLHYRWYLVWGTVGLHDVNSFYPTHFSREDGGSKFLQHCYMVEEYRITVTYQLTTETFGTEIFPSSDKWGATVYLNLSAFLQTCRKDRFFSGNIVRGNRSHLYLFCNSLHFQILQLTVLHSCSRMSVPLSKNKPPVGKTHVTIPCKQMNTCALKQENSNHIWKRDMSDLFPHST